jgi:hypothetical protein
VSKGYLSIENSGVGFYSPTGNDHDASNHEDSSENDSWRYGFHTSKEERAEKHSEERGGIEERDDD